MHLFDVEEAVDLTDFHGLRQAFNVLVDYPDHGHIEGARTAAKLIDLFDRVTLALEFDHTLMHERLCQVIERVTSMPVGSSATYSHGAIIASEARDRWHGRFSVHGDRSGAA